MQRYTYRVEIAYDGAAFASFASVPGQHTVWSTLRDALFPIAPGFAKLASAGRTDRGVSATGQVISFISRDPVACEAIARAIDEACPNVLVSLDVRRVSNSFHAQFSASFRRYVYLHQDDDTLDVTLLDRMLSLLVGRRCFGAFARETPHQKRTIKTLTVASARRVLDETGKKIRFDFAGESFLRRQVRVLVATSIREARTFSDESVLVELALSGDRRRTAQPAPPEGLYLTKVGYDPLSRRR